VKFPAGKAAKKTQTEAAAKIADLRKMYGENFEQVAETASVQFKGKPVKVRELLQLAEMNLTTEKGPVSLTQPASFSQSSDQETALRLEFEAFTEKNGRPPNAQERAQIYHALKAKPVEEQHSAVYREFLDAKREGYKGTFQQYQNEDANRKRPTTTVSVGGLNPRAQTALAAVQRSFEANPVVKRAATMSEAVDFVNSLPNNSQNPADDQALIYAFAKAMDPESVVREGEYATVQKYAQSWLSSFGFNAQRVISNSEFLTPQARQNMKATIMKRFAANKSQYDRARGHAIREANRVTEGTNGGDLIPDYSPSSAKPGNSVKIGRFDVQIGK
jgi:hypothetical protein